MEERCVLEVEEEAREHLENTNFTHSGHKIISIGLDIEQAKRVGSPHDNL